MSSAQRTPMTFLEVGTALWARPHWSLVDGRLVREHTCGSFAEAQAAAVAIAVQAECLDHHPDLMQRGSRLRVETMTHRPRGLSARDFELADAVDRILDAGEQRP